MLVRPKSSWNYNIPEQFLGADRSIAVVDEGIHRGNDVTVA